MGAPFELDVATLSGETIKVEVCRDETVQVLRGRVACALQMRPYRVTLFIGGSEEGQQLSTPGLEDHTRTLEQSGFCGEDVSLFAVLAPSDACQELDAPGLLHAACQRKLLANGLHLQFSGQFERGELGEAELRKYPFIARLGRMLAAEEETRLAHEERFRAAEVRKRQIALELAYTALHRSGLHREIERFVGLTSLTELGRRVEAEQDEADVLRVEYERVKSALEADIATVLPALEDAQQSLDMLCKCDFAELSKTRPFACLRVAEALCILFGFNPTYDESRKRLFSNCEWIELMKNFDKDNISASVAANLRPYIDDEDLHPERVAMVSVAAHRCILWVRAMYQYHYKFEDLAPRRKEFAHVQCRFERQSRRLDLWQAAARGTAVVADNVAP